MAKTVAKLLHAATQALTESDSARLDAELLLQHLLNCERSFLYAHPEQTLSTQQQQDFDALLAERQRGRPIAHLTGAREFWSLDLQVTPDTLIPRPETELLVETALKLLSRLPAPRILELGTGSGAIALALAHELPNAQLTATDISSACLQVAEQNAKNHRIDNIDFIRSDWFSALPLQDLAAHFDLIVSNPPYIPADDPHLQQGDLRYEPQQALVSAADGLSALTTIINNSKDYLHAGGQLLLEHGYDQGPAVMQTMQTAGFSDLKSVMDLAAHHRATHAVKS